MPDGEAGQLRAFTREQLRCLIPDCSAPNVIAVARSTRRDGFTHRSGGGGHAPESVHHRQGKAVLAQWLRGLVGADAVTVEAAIDTQRSRVADVLVTFPTGARLAFEVQYAAITVEAWRERHQSYVDQGIVDVWLWGHTRLRRSRSSYDSPFRLDDVQDEVRVADMPVHWFNPETGEIATAIADTTGGPLRAIPVRYGDVLIQPLSACGVNADGIQSGPLRELADQVARHRALLEKRAREMRERIAEQQENQRRTEERYAQLKRQAWDNAAAGIVPRLSATASIDDLKAAGACVFCRAPLNPIIVHLGYHPNCVPGFWRRR